MKKIFFIAAVLLSAFCFFSCVQKSAETVKEVLMDEAENFNDAVISGYVMEVGMTSITIHTDTDEIMVFITTEADMSRAVDAKAGDPVTVFYLPVEDANELPMATMVEVGTPN